MSRIRVAPMRSRNNHVLFTLSKWVSRYKEKAALEERKDSTSAVLIESTQARQLAAREKVFERQLPFSWPRFVIGIISLVLVFSDVPRSGLGISSMRSIYPSLQPDEMMGFGTSWNYSVFASSKNDALSGKKTARVWSYKYDSTSIVWRAFARFLAVADFPDCFFYTNSCPNTTFGGDVAFRMIDGLVDAVSNVNNSSAPANSIPVRLTLRTESEYIDRFHQFLLPTWFTNINWRTNQALYYSPELLAKKDMHICFPTIANGAQTPRFCQELWINFDRSCSSTDLKGRSVGLLYAHTLARLHDVQTRFSNLTVDLTFLESQEDMQVSRGGLGLLGFRRSDISTIIRARQCISNRATNSCETLYVQDYRYETGLMTADVTEWYRLAALLRTIGQSYFILRGIGLMLSCYFVYGINKPEKRLKALHLFMKMPKQCVVYGSPFPVMCYVFAHLLDAAFMYELLKGRFITQAGIVNIDLRSFVSYAVIQMRNVWMFALIWHLVVALSASRWLARSNHLNNGIIGVPSFFLSAMSSITIAAQYRSLSFRSSKTLRIMAFPSNVGRAWEATKYQYSFTHRGSGSMLLGGVIIDLKFLICFVFALTAVWILRAFYLHIIDIKQGKNTFQDANWFVLSPTPVPYSAGILWPTTSVAVYWKSSRFCIQNKMLRQQRSERSLRWSRVVAPFAPSNATSQQQSDLDTRSVQRRVDTLRFIQHRLKCLHGRSEEVEATVAFMNAVLLSDPLVYLHIVLGNDRSTQLGYYQSLWRPQQIVLLPTVVVGGHNEYTSGLQLLRRVNASELTWSELVQCG